MQLRDYLKMPRFWLMIWGGLGAVIMVYVIISALIKPNIDNSPAFLTGEMADFTLAFPPRNAPAIPFEHKGEMISLEDFKGKTVLVNFWATWCPPCLKELPSLNRLQNQFDKTRFEVVAIAADPRGPEAAGAYLDKLEIDQLDLYADPRLLFASAIGGANILPVSILYSANGREIGRLTGEAVWDSPEAIRLINAAIKGQKIKR